MVGLTTWPRSLEHAPEAYLPPPPLHFQLHAQCSRGGGDIVDHAPLPEEE